MRTAVLAVFLSLIPTLVSATPPTRVAPADRELGVLISNKALNASAAIRTFSVDNFGTEGSLRSYGSMVLVAKLTRTAATDLSFTCTGSHDSGTTDGTLQACYDNGGGSRVCLGSQAQTRAVTATGTYIYRFDVMGLDEVECTVAGTSGGADDLVTVTGFLSASPAPPAPPHKTAPMCVPAAGAPTKLTANAAGGADADTVLKAFTAYRMTCTVDVVFRTGAAAGNAVADDNPLWEGRDLYFGSNGTIVHLSILGRTASAGACYLLECL